MCTRVNSACMNSCTCGVIPPFTVSRHARLLVSVHARQAGQAVSSGAGRQWQADTEAAQRQIMVLNSVYCDTVGLTLRYLTFLVAMQSIPANFIKREAMQST